MREPSNSGSREKAPSTSSATRPLAGLKKWIKIDMEFVRDLTTDAHAAALVVAIIDLGHSLGKEVLAEGVETEEQESFLCSAGCDSAQGLHFSRPLSPEKFAATMAGRYGANSKSRLMSVDSPTKGDWMNQSEQDRPQLVAELGSFTAADTLEWVKSSQFSGRLIFRSERARITLHSERGRIVYAASNRRAEAFGRHLFSEGLIDEVDLAAAIVHSRDFEIPIGMSMLELGVLNPHTLREALHDHIVNLATLPLAWTTGSVEAETRPFEASPALRPEPAEATFILIEGAHRVDEFRGFDAVLADPEAILLFGSAALPNDAPARWCRAVTTYEPRSTLRAHYGRLGGSYFQFVATLQQLLAADVLRDGTADREIERDLAQTT